MDARAQLLRLQLFVEVLIRSPSQKDSESSMKPTPTENALPLRPADFATLAEALDYAAEGKTGYNFYDGKGHLETVLPYSELRQDAIEIARRLDHLNLERGARVALVADTYPGFLRFFFGCQYAGMVPVPLPAFIYLGGHKAFVTQLRRLLTNCEAQVVISPKMFISFLREAAEGMDIKLVTTPEGFAELPAGGGELIPSKPDELAYLQYTSGSTRFPRGVMITQKTVMNNLGHIVRHGVKARPGDRSMSWLPFYHDMGLVGLVLSPMSSQISVDYLSTRDFAMRPRIWLTLMTQNKTTVSFSPPFGYELCAQRIRPADVENFDLSNWRVAGVGAEPIRPEPLARFAEVLKPAGFDESAFLPCYGMAECSLAVSFSPLSDGIKLDHVDAKILAEEQKAVKVELNGSKVRTFVNCGPALPDYGAEVRDPEGNVLPERQVGTLFVRGPSVMSGYFGEEDLTREVLSSNGWLNTGDLAYMDGKDIVVTGREKDMIIINGRNIWPQDLEYLAESQPEVRSGDASAFSVPGADGIEQAVLVVECRITDTKKRLDLVNRLKGMVSEELGIECFIELVPRNTLPRTTSGKLSRSGARKDFLKRVADGKTEQPGAAGQIRELRKQAV